MCGREGEGWWGCAGWWVARGGRFSLWNQWLNPRSPPPASSGGKAKKGDSSEADVASATQFTSAVLPIAAVPAGSTAVKYVAIKDIGKSVAFRTMRQERCNARLVGIRAKKAAEEAAKAEKAAPKEGAGEAAA